MSTTFASSWSRKRSKQNSFTCPFALPRRPRPSPRPPLSSFRQWDLVATTGSVFSRTTSVMKMLLSPVRTRDKIVKCADWSQKHFVSKYPSILWPLSVDLALKSFNILWIDTPLDTSTHLLQCSNAQYQTCIAIYISWLCYAIVLSKIAPNC